MRVLLWKISETNEEEKNIIFNLRNYNTFDLITDNDNEQFGHLIPNIDLSFYKLYICTDNRYTYIVLDIYQIIPDIPNKDYIYPLLRKVYLMEQENSKRKILQIQNGICQNVNMFQEQKCGDLYFHQFCNVNWMVDVEKTKKFEILKENYLMITNNIAINIETFEFKYKEDVVEYIKIPGGCLMDDYGMGKTRCVVKLVEKMQTVESINPFHLNSTLIICPHDVCLIWRDEILECNPRARIKIISTPTENQEFINYDYVIMSFKYFNETHKVGYQEYMFENNDLYKTINIMRNHCHSINKMSFQITNFRWKRLILDDIHEIFRLKQNDYFLNGLHQIDAEFKWAITGQQIFHSEAIINILKYIMSTNNISNFIRNAEYQYQLSKNFRKTVFQKRPISEKILDFNVVEKNGYLKQRTRFDKQNYTLFPFIQTFQLSQILDILKNEENNCKFIESNLSNIQERFCYICFMKIQNNNLSVSKCGHHGCFECMIKSQEVNRKCPFCRTNLYINDLYLVDDGLEKNYYGPKIKTLIDDLKLNLKTIVYLEAYHINKLSIILDQTNIPYKILKGSMRYKYNIVKQFEKEDTNFVLIMTDPLVNYGIKNIDRLIILENWFKDIENKLLGIVNHLGTNNPFVSVTQYLVNDTLETTG